MEKPKVGFIGLTGCYGCLLSVIFNEDVLLNIADVVDIAGFPFIKEINYDGKYDILFIEGTVVSNTDKEHILHFRQNAHTIVALGTCSSDGGIPTLKRFVPKEQYERLVYPKNPGLTDLDKPYRIDELIQVDHYLPGCPPDKEQILTFIKNVAVGKQMKKHLNDNPVCVECKEQGNRCLLEEGKMCFGPITRGGCKAVCTTNKLECWGCRGPTDDANIDRMIQLLEEKGFTQEDIRKRLTSFAGVRFTENQQARN